MPQAGKGDRATEHAVALECQELLRHAVGQLGTDHPGANAEQSEICLVPEPFEELRARSDEWQLRAEAKDRPGVQIYDRVLLRSRLSLRLLASACRPINHL
jgi:hypothetical protein